MFLAAEVFLLKSSTKSEHASDFSFETPSESKAIQTKAIHTEIVKNEWRPADITTTHELFFSGKLFGDFVIPDGDLAEGLGNRGDLPPPVAPSEAPAQLRRARFTAVKAERVRQSIQTLQSREILPMPSKSSWCCGHGVIPAERHGKATGAPGQAQIHQYIDSKDEDSSGSHHAVTGITHCGSPFVCPECARKINAQRREDITFVTKRMLELSYSYVFATFTASHKYTDSLNDFIERFQEAQRKLKQGRMYKLFSIRWNLEHQIRTAEVTLDHPDSRKKTGWHWHAHVIVFLNRPLLSQEEADRMEAELATLWSKACDKVGLFADKEHGLKIERPHYKTWEGVIYLDAENAVRLADYAAKKVSLEASPSPNIKTGRKSERISSWEMIALVTLHKRNDLIPKLSEFLVAIKGRRSMYLSRGLAALTGLDELEDEKIVQGQNGDTVVYAFGDREWEGFSRRGKTRAAMHRLDDGMPVKTVVEAYTANRISSRELIGLDERKDAALEVFDEKTGEILVTENDLSEHFSRDCVPVLSVVSSQNKTGFRPEPTRGCLPKSAQHRHRVSAEILSEQVHDSEEGRIGLVGPTRRCS